jgi:hypothetical protein
LSVNEYNEATYKTATIKGRKETGHKLIRNKEGQEIVSTACVFTQSTISENDLIDGRPVISVEEQIGLGGVVEGYEVYLT